MLHCLAVEHGQCPPLQPELRGFSARLIHRVEPFERRLRIPRSLSRRPKLTLDAGRKPFLIAQSRNAAYMSLEQISEAGSRSVTSDRNSPITSCSLR